MDVVGQGVVWCGARPVALASEEPQTVNQDQGRLVEQWEDSGVLPHSFSQLVGLPLFFGREHRASGQTNPGKRSMMRRANFQHSNDA